MFPTTQVAQLFLDLVCKTHKLRSRLLWSDLTLVRYQVFEVNILVYALCPLEGGGVMYYDNPFNTGEWFLQG